MHLPILSTEPMMTQGPQAPGPTLQCRIVKGQVLHVVATAPEPPSIWNISPTFLCPYDSDSLKDTLLPPPALWIEHLSEVSSWLDPGCTFWARIPHRSCCVPLRISHLEAHAACLPLHGDVNFYRGQKYGPVSLLHNHSFLLLLINNLWQNLSTTHTSCTLMLGFNITDEPCPIQPLLWGWFHYICSFVPVILTLDLASYGDSGLDLNSKLCFFSYMILGMLLSLPRPQFGYLQKGDIYVEGLL